MTVKLTLSQIESLLTENEDGSVTGVCRWSSNQEPRELDLSWEFWKYEADSYQEDNEGILIPGLGTVTTVDSYGGEGEGDRYWVVVKVEMEDGSGTRWFRKDGWYASYVGGSFDGDMIETSPKEKTVVVYE